jgi:hypothetical protein
MKHEGMGVGEYITCGTLFRNKDSNIKPVNINS